MLIYHLEGRTKIDMLELPYDLSVYLDAMITEYGPGPRS